MLFNDPKTFREDMLKGYADAYPEYIVRVPGGVARSTEPAEGKVAVINGGGSGHYPAFCGIVGDGFMDATVVGNIFTSPSTQDVYDVARSVERGNGLFIVGGNYAGDKMNFNLARDQLISEGVDARTFYITDDIASAAPEEAEKRRGNVGTFFVFKAAGAAAAAGLSLDEVCRVTEKANDRTRTMSVGMRGCTLPGADEPMFHVPHGKMEVGQGIHGEAGVYEDDLVSAAEIAQLLVERVLAEAPADDSKRIAVLLDGLGSTKYEELFVVWGTVHDLLLERGYELVAPQVGEFVTSLDMEGVALAVEFLDEELEEYWLAPADTPAFRRGSVAAGGTGRARLAVANAVDDGNASYEQGSEASVAAARYIVDALARVKDTIAQNEDELARIDSVAGDGDHGRGMVKGSTFASEAAADAFAEGAAAGSVLKAAGRAWAAKAGGTSGVLWGSALEAAGEVIGDDAEGYNTSDLAAATRAALEKMLSLGGASRGDKTMLDALFPLVESLETSAEEGVAPVEAWAAAAEAATKAAEDTASLLPRVGRARPQAERSLGTPDAGAVSLAMCARAVLPD